MCRAKSTDLIFTIGNEDDRARFIAVLEAIINSTKGNKT